MHRPPIFWRLKWFLVLLVLMAMDLGPIPFTASLLIFVYLFRPAWFKKFIDKLYTGK
jgi:hypothetical protein